MSEQETLSVTLPEVRVTPKTKDRLMNVVSDSVSKRLSDHIRKAIELYCEAHERAINNEGIFYPVNPTKYQ